MQIGIEQIRLSFPLDLTVKGVEVVNPPADTLLSLQSLTVRVRALPLLRKQVLVEAIDLRNVKVNTGTMIEGMEIKGFLGKLYLHADRIAVSYTHLDVYKRQFLWIVKQATMKPIFKKYTINRMAPG